MAQIIQLTADQLIAIYSWPFPPEPDKIYEPVGIAHWLQLQYGPKVYIVPSESAPSESAPSEPAPAGKPPAALTRSQWAAFVTSATVKRVLGQQQLAGRLDGAAADAVAGTSRADLDAFTTGLLASPPSCDVLPVQYRKIVVVIGGHIVVIPIPVQPDPDPITGDAGILSSLDLYGVGVRLRAAAEAPDAGPLRDAFVAAADRMFEFAAKRG